MRTRGVDSERAEEQRFQKLAELQEFPAKGEHSGGRGFMLAVKWVKYVRKSCYEIYPRNRLFRVTISSLAFFPGENVHQNNIKCFQFLCDSVLPRDNQPVFDCAPVSAHLYIC